MLDVFIRKMGLSDIEILTKYEMAIFGETLGKKVLEDHINHSELMKYFVMEDNESQEIIGYISLWIDLDKAQINNFFIINQYQNKGLGKKLINYSLEYFKSRGVKEVTLEVRESNIPAIKLYEAFNFQEITVRKAYYSNGENALFMYLRIGSD